jgi:hypothetical protein
VTFFRGLFVSVFVAAFVCLTGVALASEPVLTKISEEVQIQFLIGFGSILGLVVLIVFVGLVIRFFRKHTSEGPDGYNSRNW